MKCSILVGNKLGSIPLMECGGVVLQEGDKLLVTEQLGEQMKKHYGKAIIIVASEERAKLKQGSYEYVAGSSKAVVVAAQHDNEEAPAVAAISSDKSMQGKRMTTRRKG